VWLLRRTVAVKSYVFFLSNRPRFARTQLSLGFSVFGGPFAFDSPLSDKERILFLPWWVILPCLPGGGSAYEGVAPGVTHRSYLSPGIDFAVGLLFFF